MEPIITVGRNCGAENPLSEAVIEGIVRGKLVEKMEAIRTEAAKEERERVQVEIAAKDEALKKGRAELAKVREAEMRFRRDRDALEEQKQNFELTVARKLEAEKERIREDTRKATDERHRLALGAMDEIIAQLKNKIDELSRKADQGSQQIQGKVYEQNVRQMLEHAFPGDEFEGNDVGRAGGDLIQRVKLASGAHSGSISWEDKDTKNWGDGWLAKGRKDQRDNKCDLVVIVTTTLPKSFNGGFDRVDGVWVTARRHAVPLAKALRQALIENHQLRVTNQNRGSKAERLFSYITSNEFHQRITALVEAYVALCESHETEKRAIQRQWGMRERQLEALLVGTAQLYGGLQGIVGKSLAEVEALSLPTTSLPAAVPVAKFRTAR